VNPCSNPKRALKSLHRNRIEGGFRSVGKDSAFAAISRDGGAVSAFRIVRQPPAAKAGARAGLGPEHRTRGHSPLDP
jgi:hypothetical protein